MSQENREAWETRSPDTKQPPRKKREEKLTKVGGDATPKSHTAVTKKLSGFVVSESAPSPPIDSCKMEFLGAGPG